MMSFLNPRPNYFVFSLLSQQIYFQGLNHLQFKHVLIVKCFLGLSILISHLGIAFQATKKRTTLAIFLSLILYVRCEATERSITAAVTTR